MNNKEDQSAARRELLAVLDLLFGNMPESGKTVDTQAVIDIAIACREYLAAEHEQEQEQVKLATVADAWKAHQHYILQYKLDGKWRRVSGHFDDTEHAKREAVSAMNDTNAPIKVKLTWRVLESIRVQRETARFELEPRQTCPDCGAELTESGVCSVPCGR